MFVFFSNYSEPTTLNQRQQVQSNQEERGTLIKKTLEKESFRWRGERDFDKKQYKKRASDEEERGTLIKKH